MGVSPAVAKTPPPPYVCVRVGEGNTTPEGWSKQKIEPANLSCCSVVWLDLKDTCEVSFMCASSFRRGLVWKCRGTRYP